MMTDERTKRQKKVIIGLVCALLSFFLFLFPMETLIVLSVIVGIAIIIMAFYVVTN